MSHQRLGRLILPVSNLPQRRPRPPGQPRRRQCPVAATTSAPAKANAPNAAPPSPLPHPLHRQPATSNQQLTLARAYAPECKHHLSFSCQNPENLSLFSGDFPHFPKINCTNVSANAQVHPSLWRLLSWKTRDRFTHYSHHSSRTTLSRKVPQCPTRTESSQLHPLSLNYPAPRV
jgi:hypothetical protein